ncbi:MAG TPA: hypothetical protein VN442_19895 [Bryobacteraceae bacterium]|nr:hypothetical protein [Bryobacteraceae bacterium]
MARRTAAAKQKDLPPVADFLQGVTPKERVMIVRMIRIYRAGGWIPRFLDRLVELDWGEDFRNYPAYEAIEKLLVWFKDWDWRMNNAKFFFERWPDLIDPRREHDWTEYLEEEQQRIYGPWEVKREVPFPKHLSDDD